MASGRRSSVSVCEHEMVERREFAMVEVARACFERTYSGVVESPDWARTTVEVCRLCGDLALVFHDGEEGVVTGGAGNWSRAEWDR